MSYKIITDSFKGKLYVKNINNGAKFYIELKNEQRIDDRRTNDRRINDMAIEYERRTQQRRDLIKITKREDILKINTH